MLAGHGFQDWMTETIASGEGTPSHQVNVVVLAELDVAGSTHEWMQVDLVHGRLDFEIRHSQQLF